MSLRHFMIGYAAVIVLLQGLETHSAEDFFRSREAGEKPLKIVCAFDAAAHLVRQHRFGRARRSDDEHVMRREERSERPSIKSARSRKVCLNSSRIFLSFSCGIINRD